MGINGVTLDFSFKKVSSKLRKGGKNMSLHQLIPVGLFIFLIVAPIIYGLSKEGSKRRTKFIPAFLFALLIVIFYLKFSFVTKGYDQIADVVIIIFSSVGLGISLLMAIAMEFINKRKNV